MTRTILMSMEPEETETWTREMQGQIDASDLDLSIVGPDTDPATIDYIVYNIDSGLTDFEPFTRLRAILNTWAGVEKIVGHLSWPEDVPFTRMVEPGMTAGMAEYFTGHVLRYHLDIDRFQADSAAGRWAKWSPPLAENRTVGILGLGELGLATAAMLAPIGFRLLGWSRSAKDLAWVSARHGADGLESVLRESEILVVILPLTSTTENILNARTLSMMPRGACLINAGRGPLIDDEALGDALALGHLRHATLDVFREEPLPPEHDFWSNPNVTVTPHIASVTRANTACSAILEQIRRDLSGESLLHVVDRHRGY